MTKLEKMLKYVSEHNEFYKNRINGYGINDPLDITQWPILTRKELQENRYNMFSENEKIEYYANNLLRMSSSGTSGIPINVYWSYNQYYSSMLSIWRLRRRYYGITPKHRKITFVAGTVTTSEKEHFISQRYKTNTLSIDQIAFCNDKDFEQIIYEIDTFAPEWIYSRPSLLIEFIERCKAKSIKPPSTIKYIELTGELLDSITRKKIKEYFNIPIANMYGTEEIGPIAYECPYGKMHLLRNNIYFELFNYTENNDTQTGELTVTGLINTTMPLIRYHLDDVVSIDCSLSHCSCGNENNEMVVLHGRTINTIDFNGIIINAHMLVSCVEQVNNDLGDVINRFLFKYSKRREELTCIFGLEQQFINWKKTIEDMFTKYFRKYVPQAQKIIIQYKYQHISDYYTSKKNQILVIED